MKAVVLALALISLDSGSAELVAAGKTGGRLRLTQAPCTNPSVLSQIKPEHHATFRQAEVHLIRGSLIGCWILNAAGKVFLVFENEEMFDMDVEAFRPETGI